MDGMTVLAIVGAVLLLWGAYWTLGTFTIIAVRALGWLGRWFRKWNRS